MKVYILFVCYNYSTYEHKIQGVYKTYTEARLAQKQIWKDLSYIKEYVVEENNMVKVGEYIDLREYSGDKGYTGNRLCLKIVYMIESDWFPQGLKDGYCVLGIEVI